MQPLKEYFTKMFIWNGKATRKQYILPTIVYGIIYSVIYSATSKTYRVVENGHYSINVVNHSLIVFIIGVILFIAQLTLSARRLKDSNRSAHTLWWNLFPVIGQLIIFIFCIIKPRPGLTEDLKNQSEL